MDDHNADLSQMELETKTGHRLLPVTAIGRAVQAHQSKRVALYPGQPFTSYETGRLMTLTLHLFHFFRDQGHDLEQIAHHPVIGLGKNRCLRVLVDGHDHL